MRKPTQKTGLGKISIGSAVALAGGLSLGAAAMYLLDPQGGRRRRGQIVHAAESAIGSAVHRASDAAQGVANRAADMASHRAAEVSDHAHAFLTRAHRRIGEAAGIRQPHSVAAGSMAGSAIVLLAVGAGLMYFLDPSAGRGRRAWARDKAGSVSRHAAERATGLTHHVGNRLQGAIAKAGHLADSWKEENPDHSADVPTPSERIPSPLGGNGPYAAS